jgi:hypothetical protein
MAEDDHELVTVKAALLGLVLTCRCGWWETTADPAVARQLWVDHAGVRDTASSR